MSNPRDPLVRTLAAIEDRIEETLTVGELSRTAYLSGSHLQRLFSLAVGRPLMTYVRGRKLARSLDDLLRSDSRVIEIAHRYGFGHEQSYIRAFRNEYGCTPGFARTRRPILPVCERVDPASLRALGQGLLSGPDIAIAPSFHVIGRPHLLRAFDDDRDALAPNAAAVRFAADDLARVPNLSQPSTYIGLNTVVDYSRNDVEYFTGALVDRVDDVPAGLAARTLPMRLCVLFRYVGEHHVTDITMETARRLYDTIDRFFEQQTRYRVVENWFFERIVSTHQDDSYCQMEWLRPVVEE